MNGPTEDQLSSLFNRSSPPPPADAAAAAPESSSAAEAIVGIKLRSRTVNNNKKRSYAQFHLELCQADFLLRTRSGCGFKYTPGDELDETPRFIRTTPSAFPSRVGLMRGLWMCLPLMGAGRVVLVLDGDSRPRKNKVLEVIEMIGNELGNGWIYHQQCKVYLFIASQRVAGCLVVEPIKEAFQVISRAAEKQTPDNLVITKAERREATLQFGNAIFPKKTVRKASHVNKNEVLNENLMGAIRCEEVSVPAACGIRAIWVTPSNRRKRVATHLLNAVRKSFMEHHELGLGQLAFSEPTSAGLALASSYFRSTPRLVYRAV